MWGAMREPARRKCNSFKNDRIASFNKARRGRKKASASNHRLKVKIISAIIERVQWSTYLAQITVYITDIEVTDGRKSAFFLIWASCN